MYCHYDEIWLSSALISEIGSVERGKLGRLVSGHRIELRKDLPVHSRTTGSQKNSTTIAITASPSVKYFRIQERFASDNQKRIYEI